MSLPVCRVYFELQLSRDRAQVRAYVDGLSEPIWTASVAAAERFLAAKQAHIASACAWRGKRGYGEPRHKPEKAGREGIVWSPPRPLLDTISGLYYYDTPVESPHG